MPPDAKLSHTAAMILQTVSVGYLYGFSIMEQTGLPSGTVYPALRRLERDGLIESEWEKPVLAEQQERPARKYYKLTRIGKAGMAAVYNKYPLLARLIPELEVRKR